MKLLAKTLFGLEALLATEIEGLGGTNVVSLHRAVSFEGDLECLYKINHWSRLAIRVLKPFLEFSAHNETVLYKRLKRFDWTKLFGLEETFCIDSTVSSDIFKHSKYLSLKTKDAIVDLFRLKNEGRRPSIDIRNPDFKINVHCRQNEFTVSLDSSGASLHRRGYRQNDRQAPLNEILASGMILLSGWDGTIPLYDPMCGSGTLLTEAFLIAKNYPPRMNREDYSFIKWEDYDAKLWFRIREESLDMRKDIPLKLYGSDHNNGQLMETQSLINLLGYQKEITLDVKDFINSEPPYGEGLIITNPPYGERLDDGNIEEFYGQIGDTLKTHYSGWDAWLISSNKNALKKIGLRPSKKITLYNGSLECKFQKFEMYKGSRKKKKLVSEA